MIKPAAIICDIHGTLIDKEGRPIKQMVDLLRILQVHYSVLLVTADDQSKRKGLIKELEKNKIPFSDVYCNQSRLSSDAEIKHAIYTESIEPYYTPKLVIDNNKDNVKMFRKLGLNCLRFRPKD